MEKDTLPEAAGGSPHGAGASDRTPATGSAGSVSDEARTAELSDLWDRMDAPALRAFLREAAKLWLAHDGLWFQAVEGEHGMESAIECDRQAWHRFSPIEAKRILKQIGREPGGGLDLLERALFHRLYSHLNEQAIERPEPGRLIFRMKSCRVQTARERKNLPDFPCKSVGIVEYERFAEAIDPRIRTRCISCPPDPRTETHVCAWEFTLPPGGEVASATSANDAGSKPGSEPNSKPNTDADAGSGPARHAGPAPGPRGGEAEA